MNTSSTPSLAVIGGGTMAEALVKGLLGKGLHAPASILVSDPLEARRDYLHATYGVATTARNAECLQAPAIVLAVKPASVQEVLGEVGPSWRPGALAISIVAGFTLDRLHEHLGQAPIVRAMPNTPCVIGQGITAIAGNDRADANHLEVARAIFGAVGEVLELPESYFDAVTGLSGSGPAYVTLIVEALIDAGVQQGLPRRIARELVCQTVVGSAMLVQQSGKHPAELKDQVVTPAGTTAAGLQVLEEAAVRATLCLAVKAATQRSKELGKASH
ncbi:MAG TPA: pyrroline-5-carboxylate reductase [Pantanalinema sp.]